MNIQQKKELIAGHLQIEGVTTEELMQLLQLPPDTSFGDLTLPCFKLARVLRKPPTAIADQLAATIKPNAAFCANSVAGYLNFTFDKQLATREVLGFIFGGMHLPRLGEGKTVCVDFSSINIAKPFHIGHLSTTVIGAALCRIYKKLGYNVVSINHLGDWGTQFGKLIVAFKKWGSREELRRVGMKYLTALYVRYHDEAERDPALDDQARHYFKMIEDNDPEAVSLFELFKEITLVEVDKTYKRLNITFDSYNGEAFYNDKMQPVLDELEQKGLLVESNGAKIVELDGMPPCLLVRKDGASLYATRDLAAAFYRKNTYNFDKCLYVVAYQQNLHFKQWFKVVELMGYAWAADLIHVQFGMVSLESGTMSTRKGNVTLLEDVFDRAVERSLQIITEKNPDLEGKELAAEKIGVGAVVFSALSNGRIKDIVFSYDKVLNFDGETAPYLQYTNARCLSVLRKVPEVVTRICKAEIADLSGIQNPEAEELVALAERYPDIIKECAEKYEPSILSRYIIDIAQVFNKFYLNHRILNCADSERDARVALVYVTHKLISEGLSLLGIDCPPVM